MALIFGLNPNGQDYSCDRMLIGWMEMSSGIDE